MRLTLYYFIVIFTVLSTLPLSFRDIVMTAFPAVISESEKLTPKEPLLRRFSQSAESAAPLLSVSVTVRVTGGEMVSVPALHDTVRISLFSNTAVQYPSAEV